MNDSLFDKIDATIIKTELTRKITLAGKTIALPVYKIPLTELFYNDKNDRIATSIDEYNRTHSSPLTPGKNEAYNKVIENFIVKSNEQAIFKTKNNIRIVGQREAGVVLPDGRVIDGNRRFTCLRQLSTEAEKFRYFEAIILPKSADAKQIKLLELMIQHGEEQRIEYDPIDMIVGMYHDIVETNMLTIAEYAQAIDSNERDVENKLKMANVFVDFLEFLNMPKHWYLIKEFSIYSAVSGTGHTTNIESMLRRCDDKYRDDLKRIVYVNILLETSGKLLDIISKLITSDLVTSYIRHARALADDFKHQLDTIPYSTFEELQNIIRLNVDIKKELAQLLDESFLKHKKNEVHSQPSKNVSKAISMIKSVDMGVLERLTEKESSEFKQNLTNLIQHVNQYAEKLDITPIASSAAITDIPEPLAHVPSPKTYHVTLESAITPCMIRPRTISTLCQQFTIDVSEECVMHFVDKNGKNISDTYPLTAGSNVISCELNASVSSDQKCWLLIKKPDATDHEVSQIIPLDINMNFISRFDF